jgi:putative phosphoribosyl transferase
MKPRFKNRRQAGIELAHRVAGLVSPNLVVAGIPRGGLAVAAPIAARLGAPLTIAFARKILLPAAPELAVGGTSEEGHAVLNTEVISALRVGAAELGRARERVRAEIERQRSLYSAPPLCELARGRDVVLVDDALTTGSTMHVAIPMVRRWGASRVIVAVPCAETVAARRLERQADGVVALVAEEGMCDAARYFADFEPLSDEAVRAILDGAPAARTPPSI